VSQNARILELLSDGREHEMRDIHRVVGFCRLNSRVAELRNPKHGGHNIVCRREGTSYFYRLVAMPGDASPQSTRGRAVSALDASGASLASPGTDVTEEQLNLLDSKGRSVTSKPKELRDYANEFSLTPKERAIYGATITARSLEHGATRTFALTGMTAVAKTPEQALLGRIGRLDMLHPSIVRMSDKNAA
jgi:hypothetical protein